MARKADHPLAGTRILLLDKPGNIQSVYQPYKAITNSYYDLFACLPPLLPDGPIGILGLGAGTAARIIHHFWPQIDLNGWELDPAGVMVARRFFNLYELEESGTSLHRKRVSAFDALNRQCNEVDGDDAANCEENGSLNSGTVQTSHSIFCNVYVSQMKLLEIVCHLLKLDHEIACMFVLYTS